MSKTGVIPNTEGDQELKGLQEDLRDRGNHLGKAWADLFSLLTTYQSCLQVKENQLDITEKQIELQKQQLTMLKEDVNNSRHNENLQEQLGAKALHHTRCQSELYNAAEMWQKGNENLQEQLEMKELGLQKCQSELCKAAGMLQKVKAELVQKTELLDRIRLEQSEKDDLILQYQSKISQLECDVQLKEEESELKDRLIQKLEAQNHMESSDSGTDLSRLRELFDMQTKTLDAERKAHKDTRKKLQNQQRFTSLTSRKVQPTVSTPSSNTNNTTAANTNDNLLIGDPNNARTSMPKESFAHPNRSAETLQESANKYNQTFFSNVMNLYNQKYTDTFSETNTTFKSDNTETDASASTSNQLPSSCPREASGAAPFDDNCEQNWDDSASDDLQVPVPVSRPVASTAVLRMAAVEAGHPSEALKTRNQRPRGLNHRYDTATLDTAITKVRNGEMSLRKAAHVYNIPKTSLGTYVNTLKRPGDKRGRGGVITPEEEREIIKMSLDYTESGQKFGRKELLNLLAQYFEMKQMPNPFKCGLPGKDWWLHVRKRHPDLIKIKSKASNKSLAMKFRFVNESNTSTSELNPEDMNISLLIDSSDAQGEHSRGDVDQSCSEVFGPLSNMDE